jgi:hypothetical protein
MTNREWIDRQTLTTEARREYERERLVTWAFEALSEAMARSQKTKADLARALETSRANITQILRGERNITLNTMADLAWACDSRVVVNTEPLRQGEFISSPVCRVRTVKASYRTSGSEQANEDPVPNTPPLAA